GTTTINLNIFVDTTGLAAFNPVITGPFEFCHGDSTTLHITPTTYDAYIWNNGSTGFSEVADSSGQYWCTARKNGCFKTVLVDVVEHPIPTPVITGALFTCFSNPTILTVDSAALYASYLWSNASTNDSITVLNGTYTVTVTDTFGCVGTSPPVTIVNANPSVSITGAAPFCPGDSIPLNAVATIPSGASYLWSTASTTSSTYVNTSGNVFVTVSYSNGCNTADTVSITQFPSPTAQFSDSPTGVSNPGSVVNFTDMSTVPSGTIVSWIWNFGDSSTVFTTGQNPTHVYGANGTYIVTLAVQSSNGCWDTIKHEYTIVSDIEVPNIFTPNGDGKNDFFEFKNLEFFPSANLVVYNRWGNKVYEKADYQNNWNGGTQKDGVYYFILTAPKLDKPVTGFIQILR
ncbi:MAG: T9SS type B sorting domain-containing protein, partial [Bacteroidia bacterium]